MITGLDHPAIAVRQVDDYAEWCCRVLDYRRVHRSDAPAWLLAAADGSLLEVMPQDDTPRPERTTWTPGWSHLALRVSDIDSAVAVLEQRGIEFVEDEVAAIGGGRLRSFADPEGNMWQLVERRLTEPAR